MKNTKNNDFIFFVLIVSAFLIGILLIWSNITRISEIKTVVQKVPIVEHVEYNLGQLPSDSAKSSKSSLLEHYESKCSDVVGRMAISDSGMETPLVNSDYYFRRDLDGNYESGGIPYLSNPNDFMVPSRNCIIYGHRLDTLEDFGMLRRYLEQDFYDNHKTIEIETDDGISKWKIISVFTFNAGTDYFDYPTYIDFSDSKTKNIFLSEILSRNEIETDIYQGTYSDTFITLSTCHYETDQIDGRLVVVAVKE